jgi:YD repeat-containing protein
MKLSLAIIFILSGFSSLAQFYYRDIIGTKETTEMMKAYLNNKVTRVTVNSYDADNTRSDDFYVEQIFSPATKTLKTITRSGVTDASVLISYVNDDGRVIKTIDSSGAIVSTSFYNYDAEGRLLSISSSTVDSTKRLAETEEHIWEYQNEKIVRMLRIKNKVDTTIVNFKTDENGNIVEELATHKTNKSEPVYYYYDSKNRITDIVRFNQKAKRLLPEYMFEYSPSNQVIQRITVPANGSNYLIWRYQYDGNGLKIREAVYNRYKQLSGKIEYQYQKG